MDQSWKRVERSHKLFNHAEQLKAIRQHLDILETICNQAQKGPWPEVKAAAQEPVLLNREEIRRAIREATRRVCGNG